MINKAFKYFIKRPLFFFYVAVTKKCSGRFFCFLFNIFVFFLEKNYIKFNNNIYYFKNKTRCFSEPAIGIAFYLFGFKKRNNYLINTYLISNIKFKKNDIIIDIGANTGDFFFIFKKRIRYIGVEPSPQIYNILKFNVRDQYLLNKAIWKKSNQLIDFYISDSYGDSSIHKPFLGFKKKIKIKTMNLDDLITQANLKKPIKLIKIEAEGAEPEVLYGLNKNINKVNYITIDAGFERGKKRENTISDCTNYLIKKNFKLINFGSERYTLLFENQNIK